MCVLGVGVQFDSFLIFIENVLYVRQSAMCQDGSFHFQGDWQWLWGILAAWASVSRDLRASWLTPGSDFVWKDTHSQGSVWAQVWGRESADVSMTSLELQGHGTEEEGRESKLTGLQSRLCSRWQLRRWNDSVPSEKEARGEWAVATAEGRRRKRKKKEEEKKEDKNGET